MEQQLAKRRRRQGKAIEKGGACLLPLPRIWKYTESSREPDDGRREEGVWPEGDKVTSWYTHPAALLEELPLSRASVARREQHPAIPEGIGIRGMRKMSQNLPDHPPHSFMWKGAWKSHPVEVRLVKTFSPAPLIPWKKATYVVATPTTLILAL